MLTPKIRPTIGKCEVCPDSAPDVEIWRMHGNIMMCEKHRNAESAEWEKADKAVKQIVREFRTTTVETKADIHIAQPIPIIELISAITNDTTIPDAEKNHAIVRECQKHVRHYTQVLFEEREIAQQALNKAEQTSRTLREWQQNGQQFAGKLREELRAQYHEFDITYEPKPITRREKTTKSKPKPESFNVNKLKDLVKKYNLTGIDKIMQKITFKAEANKSKGWTLETAAQWFAKDLGTIDE